MSPARAPKKPAAKPRATTTERRPRGSSLYAQEGERARKAAQRKLLLATLKQCDWHLEATAEALGMAGASAVVKALKDVAPEDYAAAREAEKISHGKRRK